MNGKCRDVFAYYELPFETYFEREIHQVNQIHDEIELLWLIKGHATVTCEGVKYELDTQTLFMININQLHSISTSSDALLIAYRFKNDHLVKNDLSFGEYHFENRVYTFQELVIKYKEVPLLIANLLKLLVMPDEDDQMIRYKIIGYYNMFVYELYTMLLKEKYLDVKKKNYDSYIFRVKKITEYVSENYMKRITLDEVASLVSLSRFRVSHFVKEYMGVSLQDYINNIRLEKALRKLSLTNAPILEISKMCGFSDVKYLNKMIKQKLNITALKYRKFSKQHATMSKKISLSEIREFSKELSNCLNNFA